MLPLCREIASRTADASFCSLAWKRKKKVFRGEKETFRQLVSWPQHFRTLLAARLRTNSEIRPVAITIYAYLLCPLLKLRSQWNILARDLWLIPENSYCLLLNWVRWPIDNWNFPVSLASHVIQCHNVNAPLWTLAKTYVKKTWCFCYTIHFGTSLVSIGTQFPLMGGGQNTPTITLRVIWSD